MLLFVATNPTIDRLIALPDLTVGQVHRAKNVELSAGGKAINAARAAKNLGVSARTVGFLAGCGGQLLEQMLSRDQMETHWLKLTHGETKMSHLILHAEHDTTVINEPGPTLSADDWQRFTELIWNRAQDCRAIVLAGTIPPGVAPSAYAELCHRLSTLNAQVFIDTPGATLEAILSNPTGLAIKVNRAELSEALNIDLRQPGKMAATLRALIGAGARIVGVTLGAEGAVIANRDGIYKVGSSPIDIHRVSSVGSGDSFTAGLVTGYARSWSLPESLRLAAACGIANTETPQPAHFELQRVEEIMGKIAIETVY